MKLPSALAVVTGTVIAGLTFVGLASSQTRQTGTPVGESPEMPPGVYMYSCPDGKRLNKTFQYHVIIENSYAVYQGEHNYLFFYTSGSKAVSKLGTMEFTATYYFSDIRSSPDNFTPRAWLMEPEVRGRCYREDIDETTWVSWLTQTTASGIPKADPMNTSLVTNQLKEGTEPAPPTYETWCMWRNTWNADWTMIVQREVIMCWDQRVT